MIKHAIRLTVPQTLDSFLWPARHLTTGHTSSVYPAMGQRFRLRASFNVSTYPTEIQVILVALQTYGMFVADNGSAWFISGAPDPRWNNDDLGLLRNVVGSDFEAVDDSGFMVNANSGQAAFCDLNADGVVNALDSTNRRQCSDRQRPRADSATSTATVPATSPTSSASSTQRSERPLPHWSVT